MRLIFFIFLGSISAATAVTLYESEPINYFKSEAVDSVANFFSDGGVDWERRGYSGYLNDLLATFDIPKESQVLVYSKTSLQVSHIRPENPRAIYFNKDIYVGWVPGAEKLEIIASSPTTANNFYTISNYTDRPELKRENHDCLSCHGGSFTRDIPSPLVRSVFPDNTGQPIFKAGTMVVDQTTPFNNRRGGWFVTGGPNSHHGNKVFTETDRGVDSGRLFDMANIRDNGYLMEGSDTVALLILEHQSELHRLLAHLAIQTKTALYSQKKFDELLGRTERLSESTKRQIKSVADKLLKYMFFKDEAEISGIELEDSPYAEYFKGNGPKDSRGRSLYDLKMNGRMFTYPFSYMVYSDAFKNLPDEAMEYIKQELGNILDPDNEYESFEHLSKRDKIAIKQILKETTDLL
ncbi:MAG: hypothetical protein O3C43_21675 [Verrucomicrobia bacterium]|nr:hypothetical protein [Verrucomicrobiota bacterium]MDA1069104.1 hypothetical protein [Verrucomicrobiota bacterium]